MRVNKLLLLVLLTPVFCLAMDPAPTHVNVGEVANGWTGAALLLVSEVFFRRFRSEKALSWLWMIAKVADAVAEIAVLTAMGARSLAEIGDKKLGQRLKDTVVPDVSELKPKAEERP